MTVVVPQSQRGPGLIDSGEQSIATVLGQPAQAGFKYTLTALMRAADIVDPSLVIGFSIFLDGALVYPATWHGDTLDRDGVARAPTYFYAPGTQVPTTIRLTANLPVRLSFGLDLSTAPVTQ